jgi:hypothetical protein
VVNLLFLPLDLFIGDSIHLDVVKGDSILQLLDLGVNLVIKGDIRHETIVLCEVSVVIQKTLAVVQRFSEVAQDLMSCWDWSLYWTYISTGPVEGRRLIPRSLYNVGDQVQVNGKKPDVFPKISVFLT